MDPHAADCQTAMYCNRYPSVEGKHFPEGALRIGAHTDFELLTLLFTRPGQPLPCLHLMPARLKAPVGNAIPTIPSHLPSHPIYHPNMF